MRNTDRNGFEAVQYEIIDEADLWIDWVAVRTRFDQSIDTEAAATTTTYSEALQSVLKDLGVAIATTNRPVFNVEDTEINLHHTNSVSGTVGSTVGEVLLELEDDGDDNKKMKDRRAPDVLNLDAFLNLSCEVKENGELL